MKYSFRFLQKLVRIFSGTEILIGLQEKSTKITDWLPVISIISALLISLIAFIVLCKRRMYSNNASEFNRSLFLYRDRDLSIRSRRKQHQINVNTNQKSLPPIDVAECIDEDFRFTSGLTILLSQGSIRLDDDDDIQMVLFEMNFSAKFHSVLVAQCHEYL